MESRVALRKDADGSIPARFRPGAELFAHESIEMSDRQMPSEVPGVQTIPPKSFHVPYEGA
jgi:hypothetical protein